MLLLLASTPSIIILLLFPLLTMVLKTKLGAKLDLPLVPGFGQFLRFFPNQTNGQFLIQLIGPASLIFKIMLLTTLSLSHLV